MFYYLLKGQKYRLIGIVIVTFLIGITKKLVDIPGTQDTSFWGGLTMAFTFWQGNATFIYYMWDKYPKPSETTRRIIYEFIFIVVYCIFVAYVIEGLLICANLDTSNYNYTRSFLLGFGISLFISTVYEATHFFGLWKASILESERLKRAKAETEFQALSNQINPHFLFNSLNTLVSIIPEDPQIAVRFTQKLSEVYRYILQSKSRELIEVFTELEFLDAYIFLLKIRYADNLEVTQNIQPTHRSTYIAPMVLQILVENATKHNIISAHKKLHIHIYTNSENQIIVENNLQPKQTPEKGTQTGLQNITKRYQLLTTQKVEVLPSTTQFKVIIPLLKVEQYESINH